VVGRVILNHQSGDRNPVGAQITCVGERIRSMWVYIPEAIYWVVLWIAGFFIAAQFISPSYWQYQVCC
jgi:hypothetical protein